jgi:hypothetical protein
LRLAEFLDGGAARIGAKFSAQGRVIRQPGQRVGQRRHGLHGNQQPGFTVAANLPATRRIRRHQGQTGGGGLQQRFGQAFPVGGQDGDIRRCIDAGYIVGRSRDVHDARARPFVQL